MKDTDILPGRQYRSVLGGVVEVLTVGKYHARCRIVAEEPRVLAPVGTIVDYDRTALASWARWELPGTAPETIASPQTALFEETFHAE